MKTLEWKTVDKSDWKRGEWDHEPDKRQWRDGATGLPCLMVRGPGGHWCGYVGVAEGHPWFQQHYDHGYDEGGPGSVDVHGGLTFASACAKHEDPSKGVCHLPEAGEPAHVWWFGFDCAHSGDLSPKWERYTSDGDDVYRNMTYVAQQCADLARQIASRQP